jgi:hypothetical protein
VSTDRAPGRQSEDPVDDWAEALAGRPRPDGDLDAQVEAQWLRIGLQRERALEEPPTPLESPTDLEQLLQRGRSQGLASRPSVGVLGWCAGCVRRWQRLREFVQGAASRRPLSLGGAGGLALAGLVAIGIWVPTLLTEPGIEPESVLRGPSDGVWQRPVADPKAERDRLADALAAAGASVTRYERLGRFGLDADLPQARSPGLEQLLQRARLRAAADGSLRVEFEAAP